MVTVQLPNNDFKKEHVGLVNLKYEKCEDASNLTFFNNSSVKLILGQAYLHLILSLLYCRQLLQEIPHLHQPAVNIN